MLSDQDTFILTIGGFFLLILSLWTRDKWEQSSARRPQQIDSLDAWHGSLCFLRQYLKGWNIKQIEEQLKEKNALTDKLLDLDNLAKARSLAPEEWAERYRLEERLETILQMDELAWQQKCWKKWILKGDANTDYFHKIANGRRRKNLISCLEGDQGTLTNQEDIVLHITNFYKSLFGSCPPRSLKLSPSFWSNRPSPTEADKEALTKEFHVEEVKSALSSMKNASAQAQMDFVPPFSKTPGLS